MRYVWPGLGLLALIVAVWALWAYRPQAETITYWRGPGMECWHKLHSGQFMCQPTGRGFD